jgi:hypothetical protein
MTRLIYRGLDAPVDVPIQVYWLAGLHCSDQNEWWVRTVFRAQGSGLLHERHLPIGMLPILSLGIWFDQEALQSDGAHGEDAEICIPDVSHFEVMTSDQVPADLYPLPDGKAGTQRLLRYRTPDGDVIIPAIELVRSLFLHNRAMALALMRPSGLEQLYYPQPPARTGHAVLQFTGEMPAQALGERLAKEFAWLVLDQGARRAWDSVLRSSLGRPYVMLDPPAITQSTWSFRGIRRGNQWFVLELYAISGRYLPCDQLDYGHPSFTRVVRVRQSGEIEHSRARRGGARGSRDKASDEWTLRAGRMGSASYRQTKVADIGAKWTAFENPVVVRRVSRTITRFAESAEGSVETPPSVPTEAVEAPRVAKPIEVAAGERTSHDALPALDFKVLKALPRAWMGDLDALEEAAHHMRELLPSADIHMSVVALKSGRTVSMNGQHARPAMVIVVSPEGAPPVALLDIERSGISALSLMALQFKAAPPPADIEASIQLMLDGFVDAGGHWPASVESALRKRCWCTRIPKLLVPREHRRQLGRLWACRLVAKLRLS